MAAFIRDTHCSKAIQRMVGLHRANIDVPRLGDRSTTGEIGYDRNGSACHMSPLTEGEAALVYSLIPANHKTNPANANVARVVAKIANTGTIGIPGECATMLRNANAPLDPLTFYMTLGAPLFIGMTDSHKFISFLYLNMDNGHRVKWYNLTGREQFEWYDCWTAQARTHLRNENATRGLRGTDVSQLTTQNEVRDALVRSPSLSRRRPHGHAIPQNQWNDLVQNLFDE